MAQAAFTDAYVASLQPMYAKLTQQPGALDKVTRRIARAEVTIHLSIVCAAYSTVFLPSYCILDNTIVPPVAMHPLQRPGPDLSGHYQVDGIRFAPEDGLPHYDRASNLLQAAAGDTPACTDALTRSVGALPVVAARAMAEGQEAMHALSGKLQVRILRDRRWRSVCSDEESPVPVPFFHDARFALWQSLPLSCKCTAS